jgi:hypothetical protein
MPRGAAAGALKIRRRRADNPCGVCRRSAGTGLLDASELTQQCFSE